MIFVGTSGFQYPEWVGKFYPEKMRAAQMLPYYAERFSTVEINYTFNRIPREQTLRNWLAQVPPHFKFTLKATRWFTHSKKFEKLELLDLFLQRAQLLGGQLGVVLFQFPPTSELDLARIETLLSRVPAGMRCAFEFRHTSWFCEELYALLRSRNMALCIAESQELRTPSVATADYGYLRLRVVEYTPKDIERWAAFAREQKKWKDAFVYFKHEEAGTGPVFAEQFTKFLGVGKSKGPARFRKPAPPAKPLRGKTPAP